MKYRRLSNIWTPTPLTHFTQQKKKKKKNEEEDDDEEGSVVVIGRVLRI